MYKISTVEKKEEAVITLAGFLDISNIERIREELLNLETEKKKIVFKMVEVENIDLSFLQLLIAYKKQHEAVRFRWEIDEEFSHLIKGSGFQNLIN